MNREKTFGQLLAIANVMGDRVLPKNARRISEKYMKSYDKNPAKVFKRIHEELMQNYSKFGAEEIVLMDMLGEILDGLGLEGFTSEPLSEEYLLHYHKERAWLERAISAEQAGAKWGLSAGYVKNLAASGKIIAKKVGNTWVIDGKQQNPKQERSD